MDSVKRIVLDFETASLVDLTVVGRKRYLTHTTTRPVAMAYKLDHYPTLYTDNAEEMRRVIDRHRTAVFVAHNASFEKGVIEYLLKTPVPIRWSDTMPRALKVGLSAKLGEAIKYVDPSQRKLESGKRLIKLLHSYEFYSCVQQDLIPDDVAKEIEDYCRQDVDVTYILDMSLFELDAWEQTGYQYTETLNNRGVYIDSKMAAELGAAFDSFVEKADALVKTISGLGRNQKVKLREFVQNQGYYIKGVGKEDIADALIDPGMPSLVRELLTLLERCSSTSLTKIPTMLAHQFAGKLYDSLRYRGAHSGRWSGTGWQPQNLPRNTGLFEKNAEAWAEAHAILTDIYVLYIQHRKGYLTQKELTDAVRLLIYAPAGLKMIGGDYANIEGRVAAYAGACESKLQAFRLFDQGKGPDLYKVAYAAAFGISVDRVSKDERQIGKVMELSCQYQGGMHAFMKMAAKYEVQMPADKAAELVRAWRHSPLNTGIVRTWAKLEKAMCAAYENPNINYAVENGHNGFTAAFIGGSLDNQRRIVTMWLPTGRSIVFWDVRREATERGYQVTYVTYNKGKTRRESLYGGKLFNYLIQGSCADIMLAGMLEVEKTLPSVEIVMTVHDEAFGYFPENLEVEPLLGEFENCLVRPAIQKFPGLPMTVSSWSSQRYGK